MSRMARAIADVEAGLILASVEIAASPERVFQALTDGNDVMRWWGSDDTYRTTSWSADLRAGGRWRAEGKGKGGDFVVEGEFIEVSPPRKLVQTWKADWDGRATTTLTYRLEPTAIGTLLTLRHEGFVGRPESCLNHGRGWEQVLGWLTGYLPAAANGAAVKTYLCRLISPRPTFPADMTAAERAIMQQHVAYWTNHLNAGSAVVFGPVLDPKGAWGLGVVRVPDEAALRKLQADDPAVQGIPGFRYEDVPMARVIARD
jgi:uncharacterized protein YndB with AHSA1/START domain